MPDINEDEEKRHPRRRRRQAASEYLLKKHGIQCSPGHLAKLAVLGGGPAFRKDGRYPVYEEPDLDIWAEARISPRYNSTSEYTKRRIIDQHQSGHAGLSTEPRAA